jgi:tetratricopeptide (TPR) repeat protein
MKYLVLSLFILSSANAQKMDARWHELMKLVITETELLEKANKKGDEVHYRLLELYSEKIKLVMEQENKAFLESKDGKKHLSKDKFFKQSLSLYQTTKKFGESLISRYPDSPRKGAVYYTLALNSRDYGRDKMTETYLNKALRLIKPTSNLRHHAETSLADFYYNEKRYQEAIKYYEVVVKDDADDWKPKHLLNLGWCYMKTNRHSEAIEKLQNAYFLSKDSRYVDIREQTLNHLAPFFVFANKIDDGRQFYIKHESDPITYLLSLAKRAADKGHGKETEQILSDMQNIITSKKLEKHQEELVLYELDFYRTYKRWDEHLRISRKLLDLHELQARQPELKLVSQADEGIEKVRSVAGFLQLQTAKDVKKGGSDFGKRDLKRTVAYFNVLRSLDPDKKDEYAYFIGETHYAVNNHPEAADAYKLALEDSKISKKPDVKRQRKILNSLLALVGEEALKGQTQKDYLTYTYENHVDIFPKDEMSLKIYPKLFHHHRSIRNDEAAVVALEKYNKNYPSDLSKQQELMKLMMDDFIKSKAVLKITNWIAEFKKGFLKFDAKTIEQTEIILGQILFVTAQENVAKGNKREALKIFEDVYKTTLYPVKVRSLAGIQAADLEIDLGNPVSAIPWLEKSIEIMEKKDLQVKLPELTAMIEKMAYMREFRGAVRLSDQMLKKTCSFKTKHQDRLKELSLNFHLVLSDDSITQQAFNQTRGCSSAPEVDKKIAGQILWYYWDHNDSDRMISFWNSNSKYLDQEEYVTYLLDLYWDQNEQAQKSLRSDLKRMKAHPKIAALTGDFLLQEKFQKTRETVLKIQLVNADVPFDPEAFNPNLEKFLLEIKKVGEEAKPLLSSQYGKIREQTNQQLQGFYASVADILQGLSFPHEDKDFVASFKGEMHKIAKVFQNKVVDFKKTTRKPSGDIAFASPVQTSLSASTIDVVSGGRK